jgi:hypothetical protein
MSVGEFVVGFVVLPGEVLFVRSVGTSLLSCRPQLVTY